MPFEIITSRQAAQNNGVKVLVHGRAGAGKTVLCSTAPAPLILSAESGMLSLIGKEIPTIIVDTFEKLSEVYQWIVGSQESEQYKTICLDSISELAEVLLSAEKGATRDPRKAYGEMQDKMSGWIRAFRDIKNKHVYFSAKQRILKDEMSGVSLYGPAMPGQNLPQQIPYFFDEVFSLEVGKDTEGNSFRFIRTRPNLQHEAKDRSGVLDEFEAPDLSNIFRKIGSVFE